MLSKLIEALVYSAALDLYKRTNNQRNSWFLSDKESSAMLKVVDWNARPSLLPQ